MPGKVRCGQDGVHLVARYDGACLMRLRSDIKGRSEVIVRSGSTLPAGDITAAWAHAELTTPPKIYLLFFQLAVPSDK